LADAPVQIIVRTDAVKLFDNSRNQSQSSKPPPGVPFADDYSLSPGGPANCALATPAPAPKTETRPMHAPRRSPALDARSPCGMPAHRFRGEPGRRPSRRSSAPHAQAFSVDRQACNPGAWPALPARRHYACALDSAQRTTAVAGRILNPEVSLPTISRVTTGA